MKAIFTGAVIGVVVGIILAAVTFFQEVQVRNQRAADAFKSACESTNGKAVWNFRHWECLK